MALPFFDAYLTGQLNAFYALAPYDLAGAQAQPRDCDRTRLADALARYATARQAPAAVHHSLAALRHPHSRVVVTGQQTGLLLGPLYSLAKAITAIKLARQWHREDAPVLPLFWLASQDHDSEEINHTYLLDMQAHLHRLELPLPADVPSGRMAMQSRWLSTLLQDIETMCHDAAYHQGYHRNYVAEVRSLLEECATESSTVADFFATILYRLLGHHGLIILDPLQADIAPHFAAVIARELAQPLRTSQAINSQGQALAKQGYTPQLGRAEGASNLFIEQDGKRHLLRVRNKESFYCEDGTQYSLQELLAVLEREPSRLTPAAGLRPISQDAALPTLATVVGPGELRYLAQLKPVYALHEVAMPLLVPRMHVTILEPNVQRILTRYETDYGLSLASILEDIEAAYAQVLLMRAGHAMQFHEALNTLEQNSSHLLQAVRGIDPTLASSVQKRSQRIAHEITTLRRQSAAALSNHDHISQRQFHQLRQQLRPQGMPQERLISPFSYFLKFGMQPVLTRLVGLEFDNQDWAANHHIITL